VRSTPDEHEFFAGQATSEGLPDHYRWGVVPVPVQRARRPHVCNKAAKHIH
jgi:hypothetical protein